MILNDRVNTGGNRLGQVRQGPVRAPGWRPGDPLSARKLNTMSEAINRPTFGPNPPAQHTPMGAAESGGGGEPSGVNVVGFIRFLTT